VQAPPDRRPSVADRMMDSSFLAFSMSPWEILVRGSLMYWFLFVIFRFVLRRNAGSAGITDILFIVLLGDAAQNAMIGDGQTVADGAMLISTLVAWNYLLDYLGCRFELVSRLTDAPPVLLVRHGRLQGHNMRRENITEKEIRAQLRMSEVEHLDQVKRMYLEGDGSFSILKKKT
jgi:uncharacterized membrane protein YcaP (DUF421 family)